MSRRRGRAGVIGLFAVGLSLMVGLGFLVLIGVAAEEPGLVEASVVGMALIGLGGVVAVWRSRLASGLSPVALGGLLVLAIGLVVAAAFFNLGLGVIVAVCTLPVTLLLFVQAFGLGAGHDE